MRLYAISGGPGTGKTSVIAELGEEFKTIKEAARHVGETHGEFKGKSVKETDPEEFQESIFQFQKKQIEQFEKKTEKNEIVFSDRGLGDTIAYYIYHGLEIPKRVLDYSKKFRYSGIFILDFLENYIKDTLRKETEEEQKKIHEEIIKSYEDLGYGVIEVPFMSVEERVNFIKGKIDKIK